jgi:hypothetical protein
MDKEIEEIKRLSGILNEGRVIKVESEVVFDLMSLANSARDECSRDPEHLQSMLSEIISRLNELLQGRGRR